MGPTKTNKNGEFERPGGIDARNLPALVCLIFSHLFIARKLGINWGGGLPLQLLSPPKHLIKGLALCKFHLSIHCGWFDHNRWWWIMSLMPKKVFFIPSKLLLTMKKSTETEYGQTFLLFTKQIQIWSGMVAQEVECQVLGELLLWVLKQ